MIKKQSQPLGNSDYPRAGRPVTCKRCGIVVSILRWVHRSNSYGDKGRTEDSKNQRPSVEDRAIRV